MTREAVKRLIASSPFWHDPDEPPAEMVGPINAERILESLEAAGVVMFQTARRALKSGGRNA
jgi:hypothetical protein